MKYISLFFILIVYNFSASNYRSVPLISGDLIDLVVMNLLDEIELKGEKIEVNNQNEIFIPRLGVINIKGKNTFDLEKIIKEKVRKKLFIKSPKIDLYVQKRINVTVKTTKAFLGVYNVSWGMKLGEFIEKKKLVLNGVDFEGKTNYHTDILYISKGKKIKINLLKDDSGMDMLLNHGDEIILSPNENFKKKHYYLIGYFEIPGKYAFNKDLTLMGLLAKAGTAQGHKLINSRYIRRFYIFRNIGSKIVTIEINARELLKMGDLTQNIKIEDGDVILASMEKKMHILEKMRDILSKYTSFDTLFQNTEDMRLFR